MKNYLYELQQAYQSDEMISVCWEPECAKHRLAHWRPGTWIEYPREPFRRYSHGICCEHAALMEADIKKNAA